VECPTQWEINRSARAHEDRKKHRMKETLTTSFLDLGSHPSASPAQSIWGHSHVVADWQPLHPLCCIGFHNQPRRKLALSVSRSPSFLFSFVQSVRRLVVAHSAHAKVGSQAYCWRLERGEPVDLEGPLDDDSFERKRWEDVPRLRPCVTRMPQLPSKGHFAACVAHLYPFAPREYTYQRTGHASTHRFPGSSRGWISPFGLIYQGFLSASDGASLYPPSESASSTTFFPFRPFESSMACFNANSC